MKKIIGAVISILLVGIIIISCEKINSPVKDVSTLHQDSDFTNLVDKTQKILGLFANKIVSKNLNIDSITQKINATFTKSINEQNVLVQNIYGNDLAIQLSEYNKVFAATWNNLTKRYGQKLTQEILHKECIEYFKIKYKVLYDQSLKEPNGSSNYSKSYSTFGNQITISTIDSEAEPCSWGFTVCIAGAAAAAVLCHAACETTAIAATAGLGIPACVALCVTIQAAASLDCYNSYCKQK